jgi:hypothetical protein
MLGVLLFLAGASDSGVNCSCACEELELVSWVSIFVGYQGQSKITSHGIVNKKF